VWLRIVTAVIALAIFIPSVIAGGLWLSLMITVMAVIGVYELFRMHRFVMGSFEGLIAVLGTVCLVFPFDKYLTFLPRSDANFNLFSLVVLILLGISVISKNSYSIDEAAFPVIASLYSGIGFHNFLLAREKGLEVVFFALLIVWVTDSGAYFIGKRYGRQQLCSEVSPKKTVEGAIGGVLSALVAALIFLFIYPALDYFNHQAHVILLMTVILSVVGQFGDLVESSIKRHFEVKDSGNLLPGHGGILDRFDSLLFVLPIMHLFNIF